jgi:CTP synthase
VDCPEPDLDEWIAMIDRWKNPIKKVKIALVGKYVSLHDAYISVVEALKHSSFACNSDLEIMWMDSELLNDNNVAEELKDADGIIVPGGFGDRGIEGMISAIKYARENKVPYLGLCLGMQLTIVEFARHVLGFHDAHSSEFNPSSVHQVIHIMPDQDGVTDLGGTLRLGSYPCVLKEDSKSYALYGKKEIAERHRHRYEVNNDYREALTSGGMELVGQSPDGHIVEMIEIPDHPWFIGTQAHPEFKSRPNKPHPLFKGFIAAALEHQANK